MKKVLIIDDEPDIREILGEFCEILGYIPIYAQNGREGLKLFENEKIDFIICDLKMPDIDGFEIVKNIREKDKNIPIAVCSGFIDDKTKNEIFNLGANFYLEKPFKMNDLKSIFKKI